MSECQWKHGMTSGWLLVGFIMKLIGFVDDMGYSM